MAAETIYSVLEGPQMTFIGLQVCTAHINARFVVSIQTNILEHANSTQKQNLRKHWVISYGKKGH